MIFGQNPPEITYLGAPKEFGGGGVVLNSYFDLISVIRKYCEFNLSLDIKIVCLDISDFTFSPDFFNSPIEEESPAVSEEIDLMNALISKNGVRICIFISKDYFLGSQLDGVVDSTISLLNRLSGILDVIGVDYPSIMVRIGSAYGNRKLTMDDFCNRLSLLDPNTISKLCVMNDDKPSLFSITDLLSGVYYKSGIPICFRILPHQFNDGGLTIREALFLSGSTWDKGYKPIFFHSESSDLDSDGIPNTPHPTEYLTRRIPTFGLDLDVVIESPAKEDSCLKYRMDYKALPPIVINKINRK
jgi:UV DNA damage endonuclease